MAGRSQTGETIGQGDCHRRNQEGESARGHIREIRRRENAEIERRRRSVLAGEITDPAHGKRVGRDVRLESPLTTHAAGAAGKLAKPPKKDSDPLM